MATEVPRLICNAVKPKRHLFRTAVRKTTSYNLIFIKTRCRLSLCALQGERAGTVYKVQQRKQMWGVTRITSHIYDLLLTVLQQLVWQKKKKKKAFAWFQWFFLLRKYSITSHLQCSVKYKTQISNKDIPYHCVLCNITKESVGQLAKLLPEIRGLGLENLGIQNH